MGYKQIYRQLGTEVGRHATFAVREGRWGVHRHVQIYNALRRTRNCKTFIINIIVGHMQPLGKALGQNSTV